jgi:hypothetical protein
MKKVIILEHGGGELSNQLWNFISIYAYCCERGYKCENYSFFEYVPWFGVRPKNLIVRLLFFLPFRILGWLGGYQTMAASLAFRVLKRVVRFVYRLYARLVKLRWFRATVSSGSGVIRLDLPVADNVLDKVLTKHRTVYCSGWLFRNSTGVIKYRQAIKDYLRPRPEYLQDAQKFIKNLKQQYQHVIGVHIRQRNSWDTGLTIEQDLAIWDDYNAKPYFYETHFGFIADFLKSYARVFHKDLSSTCFVVCSNKSVKPNSFPGLNWVFCGKNLVQDILTLASCDGLVGSDSTLSAFASWWGNLPLVPIQKQPDWDYYSGRTGYAEDKNLTAVNF